MTKRFTRYATVVTIFACAVYLQHDKAPFGMKRHSQNASAYCAMFQASRNVGPVTNTTAALIIDAITHVPASKKNCPVFMHHYTDPLRFWTPETSWRLEAPSGRPCNDGPFCDKTLIKQEKALGSFYRHQHPPNCSSSKFLIVDSEFLSGLGSTIHVKATMLMLAVRSGRILIDSPAINWPMTNPQTCKSRDWSCYFASMTNCSLPSDWKDLVRPFASPNQTEQYVSSPSKSHKTVNNLLPIGFYQQSAAWWYVHATLYLIRPNIRTLSAVCHIWNCIMHGRPSIAKPYAAMFIRSGDKYKEAKLRKPQEYFTELEKLNNHTAAKVTSVYVGTDDARILSEVQNAYSHKYTLFWMGYHRDVGGLSWEEVSTRFHSPKAEWQVLSSLSDLFISATADVFLGTLSSNWCRLMNKFRLMEGKTFLGFLSLDLPDPNTP
jgi:hypothetical protein